MKGGESMVKKVNSILTSAGVTFKIVTDDAQIYFETDTDFMPKQVLSQLMQISEFNAVSILDEYSCFLTLEFKKEVI